MIKEFSFKCIFPACKGSIKQVNSANNIGKNKFIGTGYGTINMRFGSKVYNSVKAVFLKKIQYRLFVNNINLFEEVIPFFIYISEVFQIPCVRKLIGINNEIIGVLINESSYNM